jgi:uncharacterized glyoxalase superfamily protein PhnB
MSQKLISMTEKELQKYEVICSLISNRVNATDASKQLNLSTRQIRRLKRVVSKYGAEGLAHKGRGRISNYRISKETTDLVKKLIKEKYYDFGPTFAAEKIEENDNIKISKETIRNIMVKIGLWSIKSRKKSKKWHVWRARKDNYGEMQQFDGSYHIWFGNEETCLLLSVDDASGKITHAKFDYNESTLAVFGFFKEYFLKNGLPVSIYLDKFSTYKINHKNAVDDKDMITQFQRAMNQVGVKQILAHSAEAKGRVERMFETLQDRLVKELRLANITTIEEANLFLQEYIVKFNAKFAVSTNRRKDLHRKLTKQTRDSLDNILSVQKTRVVNNDYTIRFDNHYFQLNRKQTTTVYKKDMIIVEEHLNGEIKLRLRDGYLSYTKLPERPKKEIDIKLPALTRKEQGSYIPPIDHPWRKQFLYGKKLNQETITTLK